MGFLKLKLPLCSSSLPDSTRELSRPQCWISIFPAHCSKGSLLIQISMLGFLSPWLYFPLQSLIDLLQQPQENKDCEKASLAWQLQLDVSVKQTLELRTLVTQADKVCQPSWAWYIVLSSWTCRLYLSKLTQFYYCGCCKRNPSSGCQ